MPGLKAKASDYELIIMRDEMACFPTAMTVVKLLTVYVRLCLLLVLRSEAGVRWSSQNGKRWFMSSSESKALWRF